MRVTQVPLSRLKRYENNPRRNDAAVEKVARAISDFGWRQPIVVDSDYLIIVGDTRYLAAVQRGDKKVPVHVATDMSAEEVRAYRIADNRVGEEAGWDDSRLVEELLALQTGGHDLLATGFSEHELARSLGAQLGAGQVDPDSAPGFDVKRRCKPGDLWLLGGHRLLCGDATKASDVKRVMGRALPVLMVTDPPYGVQYRPDHRAGAKAIKPVKNDDRFDWTDAYRLFNGPVAYVWHAAAFGNLVQANLVDCNFGIRCQVIWVKQRAVFSRGHYHWQHECCWYVVRAKAKSHWQGDRRQSTVWNLDDPALSDDGADAIEDLLISAADPNVDELDMVESTIWMMTHVRSTTGHATQKPVEAMGRPMRNNTVPGDAVYDPFCGSGTSVIAAEMLGRKAIVIELDPLYCDVIINRWQTFTGKKAKRHSVKKTKKNAKKKRAKK